MAKKFLKQYEIFFKKAIVDLNGAKGLLELFNEGKVELDLEIVFFHLQQSSEKFLKTLLDINHIKFDKTHDIKLLIETLSKHNIPVIDDVNILRELTDYAVEGRYAVIHDELLDADKYIAVLEELSKFVKSRIKNS